MFCPSSFVRHGTCLSSVLPAFPSVCTVTHSTFPWSPRSLGLAKGFEVVVEAWGHKKSKRSHNKTLLSSPAAQVALKPICLTLPPFPCHESPTPTPITASHLWHFLVAFNPFILISFFFLDSMLFCFCDSKPVSPPILGSPLLGVLSTWGLPSVASFLPSLAKCQGGRQPDSLRAAGSFSSGG